MQIIWISGTHASISRKTFEAKTFNFFLQQMPEILIVQYCRSFLTLSGLIFSLCLIASDAKASCATGTVTTAEGPCTTASTAFTITSSGSIIGGYPNLAGVSAFSVNSTSGILTNNGTIAGTNGSLDVNTAGSLNIINATTGIIYGNYPVNINAAVSSFTNNGQIYVDGQNA